MQMKMEKRAGVSRRSVILGGMALAGASSISLWGGKALAADGDLLTVAVDDFGNEVLDPILAQPESMNIISAMYEGLFSTDPKTGALTPGIVTKWTMAPDGLSWTFEVRDDVLFHDGSKLTANDVAFSILWNNRDESRKAAEFKQILGDTPKVDVLDDKTVRVNLPAPQPFFAYNFAPKYSKNDGIWVVPKDYIEKNGADYFRAHPVGTGPYKLTAHTQGDSFEFEAVDKHWSGIVPGFKKVKLLLVPEENTRVLMLQSDEIDFSPVGIDDASNLKSQGFTVGLGGTEGGVLVNFIGVLKPEAKGMPLADVRVRQALSLAINRQEIVDKLFGGLARVANEPRAMSYTTPDFTPALKEKWAAWYKENYRYDPDAAKALLKQAGYENGFSFDYWSAPDSALPNLNDLDAVLAGYWKAVGVTVNIVNTDGDAMRSARNTKKSTQLIGKAAINAVSRGRIPSLFALDHYAGVGSWLLLDGSPLQAQALELYGDASTLDPAKYEEALDKAITLCTSVWVDFGVVTSQPTLAFGQRIDGSNLPNAPFVGLDLPLLQQAKS